MTWAQADAGPTVAIGHEWVTTYGGSEQVAARLAESLGASTVYTFAAREALSATLFGEVPVEVSRLGQTDFAADHWQWLLPIMGNAWRRFDTSSADLVVTSSHACVNAIEPHPHQTRVSYCHTPMRYAWFWRQELGRFPKSVRRLWPAMAARMRRLDRRWSSNVDVFVANSSFTARRIADCYDRSARVVHPPIDVNYWTPDATVEREDFLLIAGRLVSYKLVDEAVAAATETGTRLVVAGDGPMLGTLREVAGPSVEFVVGPTRDELRNLYRRAAAIVYPQVEEFGMTLVEAAACGAPAIARDAGGACETVVDGVTGTLYPEGGLERAITAFDSARYDSTVISRNAERYGVSRFDDQMRSIVAEAVEAHSDRTELREWASELARA